MSAIAGNANNVSDKEVQGQSMKVHCPVCGAIMSKVGSFWQCPRCQFRVCECCDDNGFAWGHLGTNPPD